MVIKAQTYITNLPKLSVLIELFICMYVLNL